MKQLLIFMAMAFFFAGCGGKSALQYQFNTSAGTPAGYPDVSFAVISDTHVYDVSLGSSGEAFEDVMYSDRKLLLDSFDLLDFAIDKIIASGVKFVLISGDLTKDGELVNHQHAAKELSRLKTAGISVFVIPGNHDVNNEYASVRFEGDRKESVPPVSAEGFAENYADFGYNQALYRDPNSLSYVAEPTEGLWVLAIDSCTYRENDPGKKELVYGKIYPQTLEWITDILQQALNENKAVIAFMHHGVVEHWKGQTKLHPEYLVQDHINFGKFLASWNVRTVFTGHYHAQDVVRADFDEGKFIYDIETGSLVTAPCPIRFVEIKDNVMNIRTETIVDQIYPGTDFAAEAIAFVKHTVVQEAENILRKYKVSAKDTAIIAEAVGDAFTAHYNGDEDPALRPPLDRSRLGLWGRFVLSQYQYALDGLWQDLPPADNNVSLPL